GRAVPRLADRARRRRGRRPRRSGTRRLWPEVPPLPRSKRPEPRATGGVDPPGPQQSGSRVMPGAVDYRGLRELLDSGAQLVEVLPEQEYEEEHLPGAINIPLKQLDGESVARLD